MMTIIYGGSFNPPTIAHYEIAKYIIEKYPKNTFFFLPTNDNYGKDDLEDQRIRLEMLEILCKKLGETARVSDFELRLPQYKGTAYTLSHFNNPCFVMGADNLITIHKWLNFPDVVQNNQFMIIPRDDISIEDYFLDQEEVAKYRHHFYILEDFKQIYVSSSEYRETQNDELLVREISQYIKKYNLYSKEG